MKVVALVQARMGSTRLPNKVMKPIDGKPMIELLLSRLSQAGEVDEIVVATSEDARNRTLIEHVKKLGYACELGSENDVLDRFVHAAKVHHADIVVRITADCPLTDPALVDEVIRRFKAAGVDYFSNVDPPTYPDGLSVEVCTFEALERASRETSKPHDREHVTPYLRESGQFSTAGLEHHEDLAALRWTVDEQDDFVVVEKVFQHFHPRTDFTWGEVLDLQRQHPEFFSANRHLVRNEGSTLSIAEKLKRAHQNLQNG